MQMGALSLPFSCTRCKWVILVFHILEESAKICTSPFHPQPTHPPTVHPASPLLSQTTNQTRPKKKKTDRDKQTSQKHKPISPFYFVVEVLCLIFTSELPSFLPSLFSSKLHFLNFRFSFSFFPPHKHTHTCSLLLSSVLFLTG